MTHVFLYCTGGTPIATSVSSCCFHHGRAARCAGLHWLDDLVGRQCAVTCEDMPGRGSEFVVSFRYNTLIFGAFLELLHLYSPGDLRNELPSVQGG